MRHLSHITGHNSPFQSQRCRSTAQGGTGLERARGGKLNHGESRSGGHLPPGPRHGRRRRRARCLRGEGSEPGKFPCSREALFFSL
jgi:hypothetical protein